MTDLKLSLLLYYLVLSLVFEGPAPGAATAYGPAAECSPCSPFSFLCGSGECITFDDVCDGTPNCVDGSDETAAQCIHTPCPHFAFRCAYGGCITGNARCDGHLDCIDGSDETLGLCAPHLKSIYDADLRGNCSSPNEMRCKSGECINYEYSCDGFAHCRDASDETVELCSHLYCPAFAFRCGYGGCISGNAKCDGIADCYDGSDEVDGLCGRSPPTPYCPSPTADSTVRPPTTTTTSMTPPRGSSPVPPPERVGCLVPFHRRHLDVLIAKTGVAVQLGEIVPTDTIVNFGCGGGARWQLEGQERNACVNSTWLHEVPHCNKYCPRHTLRRGISTVLLGCSLSGRPLSCSKRQLIAGVEARIDCAPGYRRGENASWAATQTLHCDDEGEWDFPRKACTPVCGEPSDAPGGPAKAWHVSVFRRLSAASMYEWQCSATILTPQLVLTAASCLKTSYDPQHFNVVEGDSREDYATVDEGCATKHQVALIVPSTFYKDRGYLRVNVAANYEPELAALVLRKYFVFGPNLAPICVTFLKGSQKKRPIVFPSFDVRIGGEATLLDVGMALYDEGFALTGIISGSRFESGEQEHIDTSPYIQFLRRQMRRYKGPL